MKCPKITGTLYHNYKDFFCLVLLIVCDANYLSTMSEVGENENNNDCSILANSSMGKLLENEELNLPKATELKDCKFNYCHIFYWVMRFFHSKDG